MGSSGGRPSRGGGAAGAVAAGAVAALGALASVGAAGGCAPRFAEPPAHEEHGHLVVFNLSHGGRVVAYHLTRGRSRRMIAFHGPDSYRYVRLPIGKNAIRFEVDVGGVVYETKVFDVTGDSTRLVCAGVGAGKTVFRELGGPRGRDLIERGRTGSPLQWSEVE